MIGTYTPTGGAYATPSEQTAIYQDLVNQGYDYESAMTAANYYASTGSYPAGMSSRVTNANTGFNLVSAVDNLFSAGAKLLDLRYKYKRNDLLFDKAQKDMAKGDYLPGTQTYGGINIFTMLAFAAVGILIIIMFTRK